MEPAGMVHALEIIPDLMLPGGSLIDIHPCVDPPVIEVSSREGQFQAGFLQETGDFIEYAQAEEAIAGALEKRLLVLERRGEFDFSLHACTFAELEEFLKNNWSDAIIEQATAEKVEELYEKLRGEKEVILRERVIISRLRPEGSA